MRFRERQVLQGENETWVQGFIGDTGAQVFIYEDQVELNTADTHLNLERWDARTPAELIETFMASVSGIAGS